jgi:O-antigen ligase
MIAIAFAAAGGAIAFAGTRFGVALALTAVFGPLLAYGALRAPLVFPFALFVLLVPFDNLLTLSSFGTLTRFVAIACDGAIAFWFLRHRRALTPDRSLLAWSPLIVLGIASFGWASDPATGIPTLESLLSLFVLYALVSFMPVDLRTLRVILAAVVGGAVLAGAYGGYLFRRGIDVSQDGRLFVGNHGANSIDPNHFAAALLVPLFLAINGLISPSRWWIRAGSAAAAATIAIGIFVSGSRGAIVAAACMFLYMLWRSRRRMILAGIAVATVALGLGAFGAIVQRFHEAAASGGAGRLGIWRVGLAAFMNHPIVGSGLGNFAVAYNNAFLSVAAFSQMKIVEGARWSVAPHNNVVWVAVELGILGVIALLAGWWVQFKSLRIIPPDDAVYPLRITLEAGVLGMFVCGFFLGTITYKYLWLCFMLVVLTRNAYLTTRRISS